MPLTYPLIEELFIAPDSSWCFESFAPRPFSFWLDSGMDSQKLGRWSFMGSDPFLVVRSWGDEITIIKNRRRKNGGAILSMSWGIYSSNIIGK